MVLAWWAIDRGYTNLVVLDKHQANLDILKKAQPGITCVYADLAEPGEWMRHFDGADVVLMLQAQIGGLDYADFQRNNIDSTRHILDVIKASPKQPYLVHISSSVVCSVADDFYTRSKIEQEQVVPAASNARSCARP